ncbi:hypothetical protein K458DRAFT_93171 [Lentithecium fluviatile CBS 122367]|uniref:Uncharacterized protein n=1 Tax=Lentithecium fluviatile CBS 122367 TaxID=1168545 RepID=A0A6G1IPW7_9PLEO|nr:hypothetical protein K458DRAFT_93171 [Lentithecium fluviatile CBS 122367]
MVCDNQTPQRLRAGPLYPTLPGRSLLLSYIYALRSRPSRSFAAYYILFVFALLCQLSLPRRLFNHNPGGGFPALSLSQPPFFLPFCTPGHLRRPGLPLACLQINSPILAVKHAVNIEIKPLQLPVAALVSPT